MKTQKNKQISYLLQFCLALVIAMNLSSCDSDKVGDNYYTFTGDMIYSYLKKDTTFSEFVKIVDKAKLDGMLSAYGTYTCFAPTNNAIRNYYKSLGSSFKFDSLTSEQINYIAKTHIISLKYLTSTLVTGAIPTPNMNERYILINFTTDATGKQVILLNNAAKILLKDIEVENGSVQIIDNVLKPSNAHLPELLANNTKATIFHDALMLTGLSDSLRLVEDNSYVKGRTIVGIYGTGSVDSPPYRKYGYTMFVESDSVFAANGIYSLADLKLKAAQWYPTGAGYETDYTNRLNSLNQFIAYHLLDRTIQYNNFVSKYNACPNVTHYDFFETMYPNTMIKVNDGNDGLKINQDAGRGLAGITILPLDQNSPDQSAINGIYHMIDKVLLYNSDVENMLSNTRIRLDVTSTLPEMTTNGIRGVNKGIWLPTGYSKYLTYSADSKVYYLEPHTNWVDYQGDEMMALGNYDITFRLPPVPAGTYELRFGYSANDKRGVAQIYVDGNPVGIPLDIRILASDPKIGWLADASTLDNGIENDKMMRNRGYMKGPDTFWQAADKIVARDHSGALRRVIGTFSWDKPGPHYIRFKSVLSNTSAQFMMDYFEYVPKNVYANPDGEDRH